MANRQVSKSIYWLKPPRLHARCPIICQDSRKWSSPSLFLSNELISWSAAAGFASVLQENRKKTRIERSNNLTSHGRRCSTLIIFLMCVCDGEMRQRQAGATGMAHQSTNSCNISRGGLAQGSLTLSPSSGHCVYFSVFV